MEQDFNLPDDIPQEELMPAEEDMLDEGLVPQEEGMPDGEGIIPDITPEELAEIEKAAAESE